MKQIHCILATLICATSCAPQAALAKTYRLRIVEVTDGDTFVSDRFTLDTPVKFRLNGINTPEIGSAKCPAERAAGIAARAYLSDLFAQAGNRATAKDPKPEKYGRQLSKKLRIRINGKSVDPTPLMIGAGHGVAYSGEKRDPLYWCARLEPKLPADLLDQVKP